VVLEASIEIGAVLSGNLVQWKQIVKNYGLASKDSCGNVI
jgi:hypothetical protein